MKQNFLQPVPSRRTKPPTITIDLHADDPTGVRAVEAVADALGSLLAAQLLRLADSRIASGGTISAAELDDLAAAAWRHVRGRCALVLRDHDSAGAIAIKAAVETREEAARRNAPRPRVREVEFTRVDGKLKARVTEPARRAGR